MFSCINRVTIPYFISGRSLLEACERNSKTYSWVVFVGAHIVIEILWQTTVAIPVFASWYYPTGLAFNDDTSLGAAERGAVSFVLLWLFLLWSSTISQMFAALFEHPEMAMDICTLFYWLVLVFCGYVSYASDAHCLSSLEILLLILSLVYSQHLMSFPGSGSLCTACLP
jgi:ABC-type multidrug transport system permease subunit